MMSVRIWYRMKWRAYETSCNRYMYQDRSHKYKIRYFTFFDTKDYFILFTSYAVFNMVNNLILFWFAYSNHRDPKRKASDYAQSMGPGEKSPTVVQSMMCRSSCSALHPAKYHSITDITFWTIPAVTLWWFLTRTC